MASMLRSGKFFRFFSSITRSFDVANNSYRSNQDTLLCNRELDVKIYRSLATVQLPLKTLNDGTTSQLPPDVNTVDQALTRMDLEIKKSGRLALTDIESVIEHIQTQNAVTSSQSLLLIRCCGNLIAEEPPEKRTKLVQKMWKMLENIGVPLDISHYNALLRVYLENEHNFNPLKFLGSIEKKNVQPNRVTYQRLMAAYCQKGDIEGASQVLEIMKNKDLPIGEAVFNSLVMGHSNTGDMESAKGVIKVMSQAGLEPDAETYRTLMCGYAKNGLMQELTNTKSECEQKEIHLLDRDLLEVLYSAAIHRHSEIVDMLLSRMQKNAGYNQDCVNVILRLINQKREDEAFKILLTMKPNVRADGQPYSTGGFFIRQVVKANCSPEKIVDFCRQLVECGLNSRSYIRALESSNELGNVDLSTRLIMQVKGQKEVLRPSMFWPLLTSQSKIKGEKGVLDVLKQMSAVRVTPNVDTIHQHVLPHLAADDGIKGLLKKLRSADVPSTVVASSLLLQSIDRRDFDSAIQVAQSFELKYDSDLIRKAVAQAYLSTKDAVSVAKLIRSMLRYPQPADGEAEILPKDHAAELTGPILKEVYLMSPKPKLTSLEPLLKALRDQGLSVSQSLLQYIQESAGDEMTDSVAELLAELSSGKLTPVEMRRARIWERSGDAMDRRQIRFTELARTRQLDEALKLKEALDADKVPFTDGMKVLLMDLYANHQRADEAMEVFTQLYTQTPDIKISSPKLLSLATNLLKADRTEDALKVLGKLQPSTTEAGDASGTLDNAVWRLLNVAAEKGDVGLTQNLFRMVESSKISKIGSLILGPLVKVHLVKEDLDGAMKAFAEYSEAYRATPLKSTLTAKLIEIEDAQRLQQLMDISIKVHGEMNSLYDLVFAFLNCGRVRQAKKVLETPGLRARSQRLETACKRYAEEKRVNELENLVKITKDVFGIDRDMMYDYLLDACINVGDTDRALSVWTQMQEENVQPKDEFLRKLGKFLESKNQPVPFAIPEETQRATRVQSRAAAPQSKAAAPSVESSVPQESIRRAIQEENIDKALQIKQRLAAEGKRASVGEDSLLVEALVRTDRLKEATSIVIQMLEAGTRPVPRIFKFFARHLKSSGDKESIIALERHLTPELKRLISYENMVSSVAATDASSASSYIDSLLQDIKKTSAMTNQSEREEAAKELASKFPRGGVQAILEKNPELLEKCKEVADEYLKLGYHGPTNALWCHYLINGRKEEAQSAWDTIKSSSIVVGFTPVCRRIRDTSDLSLAETLVEMLSSSPHIKTTAIGLAYSAWIDVLSAQNKLDEGVATVNKALERGVKLNEINTSALNGLKAAYDQAGRVFPFTIPEPDRKSKRNSQKESDVQV